MINANPNPADKLKPTREIIKSRRIDLGISRKELAKLIGKNYRTILRYEEGETAIPYSVLVDICKILDMDIFFSLGRD